MLQLTQLIHSSYDTGIEDYRDEEGDSNNESNNLDEDGEVDGSSREIFNYGIKADNTTHGINKEDNYGSHKIFDGLQNGQQVVVNCQPSILLLVIATTTRKTTTTALVWPHQEA